MPLSSGDSGPPRGDSWSPFSNGGRTSVWCGSWLLWLWSVSEREALPSGIVLLSTSEWIISLLRDSLKLTEYWGVVKSGMVETETCWTLEHRQHQHNCFKREKYKKTKIFSKCNSVPKFANL
jgi:hypothetical protein